MDPDRILALAALLARHGDLVRDETRGLVAAAEAAPWQGRAAEAAREQARRRAADLRRCADAHDDAAAALRAHAAEVADRLDALSDRIDPWLDRVRGLTGLADRWAA